MIYSHCSYQKPLSSLIELKSFISLLALKLYPVIFACLLRQYRLVKNGRLYQ